MAVPWQNQIMKSALSIIAFLCTSVAGLFAQGSLTPPGAPAPTMKSLSDIDAKLDPRTPIPGGVVTSPFFINRAGSYYLTGNRTNTTPGLFNSGISVNANDVTIDLNGFILSGAGAAQTGISTAFRTNLTILNGTIRDFAGVGIGVGNAGSGVTITGVSVINNGGIGIGMLAVNGCRVVNCVVEGNRGGIGVNNDSIIANNRIMGAGGGTQYGINAADNCLITENVVSSLDTNAAYAWGIFTIGEGCRIIGNTVTHTSDAGIETFGSSIVKDNYVSYSNLRTNQSGGGIVVFNTPGEVEDNIILNCPGAGIAVHSGRSSVINNRIKGSPAGIFFGGGAGNSYFANNRVSGATNAFAGTVPSPPLNAGGNISF
jgi:hypothetical protein